MIAVTPSLFVGERSELAFFGDLRWADTPDKAAAYIQAGMSAQLPMQEDWEKSASEVLERLGVSSTDASRIIAKARRVNEV